MKTGGGECHKAISKSTVEYFLLATRLFFVTFQTISQDSSSSLLFEEKTCSRLLCQLRSLFLTMRGAVAAAAADVDDDDDCDDKDFFVVPLSFSPYRSIDLSIYPSTHRYLHFRSYFFPDVFLFCAASLIIVDCCCSIGKSQQNV